MSSICWPVGRVGHREVGCASDSGEPVASFRVRRGDFQLGGRLGAARPARRYRETRCRWDPARVLAECEIMREIIALRELAPATCRHPGCRMGSYGVDRDQVNAAVGL